MEGITTVLLYTKCCDHKVLRIQNPWLKNSNSSGFVGGLRSGFADSSLFRTPSGSSGTGSSGAVGGDGSGATEDGPPPLVSAFVNFYGGVRQSFLQSAALFLEAFDEEASGPSPERYDSF